jgi:hypothetical protein
MALHRWLDMVRWRGGQIFNFVQTSCSMERQELESLLIDAAQHAVDSGVIDRCETLARAGTLTHRNGHDVYSATAGDYAVTAVYDDRLIGILVSSIDMRQEPLRLVREGETSDLPYPYPVLEREGRRYELVAYEREQLRSIGTAGGSAFTVSESRYRGSASMHDHAVANVARRQFGLDIPESPPGEWTLWT